MTALTLRKLFLCVQEHKFFDSADWALNKEAAAKQGAQAPKQVPEEKLKPKLEPTPIPTRRVSHLDPMDIPGVKPVDIPGKPVA